MSIVKLASAALKIPQRIERGPTDILKALSATVKYVPDQANFGMLDDPYLYPNGGQRNRTLKLARINGAITAKYMLTKHPELFFRDQAEPKVAAFMPPEQFTDSMEFTEEDIKWCIDNFDVKNGLIAYQGLKEELTDDLLLDFFEMICYSNEDPLKDTLDCQFVFWSWVGKDMDESACLWKINGVAQKIFLRLKEKQIDPSRSFSAMIAGTHKYKQFTTTHQLFDDFKQAHPEKALFVEAYQSLLLSIPKTVSSIEKVDEAIDHVVNHMAEHNIKPSVNIFNAILFVYQNFRCDEKVCMKALSLLNDMNALHIKPSLTTFYCLVTIISKSRSNSAKELYQDILTEIITNIEHFSDISDHRDEQALIGMMNVFAKYEKRLSLCNRLHQIFLKIPNCFTSNQARYAYFNAFFSLIIIADKLENILKFYNDYKFSFTPNPEIYDALADALELYGADQNVIDEIGMDIVETRQFSKMKNDKIFKKNPAYEKAIEEQNQRFTNKL